MVRVVVLGMGLVASHLMVGVERIKRGELEPVGVPLARYEVEVPIEDIEFVAAYDVDPRKVGGSAYEAAMMQLEGVVPVPESLRRVPVRRGIHAGSAAGLIEGARGIDEDLGLWEAVERIAGELEELEPDVIIDVITTEKAQPFRSPERLEEALKRGEGVSASHAYAYAAYLYMARTGRRVALINGIPAPLANDPAVVSLYEKVGGLVLGDDGATGATPLTADLLEHLAERNRRVLSIAQFNIGGNLDFKALTIPEKNKMKEYTKSSIVEDILGYDVPHYIKPTGYLEPLGDKKFVSMHIWWKTFNGLEDELVVNLRINDSPALAGLLVDLVRVSKSLLDRGFKGTVYEVNAFFMKKPGPEGAMNKARIVAYHDMLRLLEKLEIVKRPQAAAAGR